jgi:hypothetical protein
MLLATATPVQLDPIEAWDLLEALNRGHDGVLGSLYSSWRTAARSGLDFVAGREEAPSEEREVWQWLRDPLPPASESPDFRSIRGRLGTSPDRWSVPPEAFDQLGPPEQARVRGMGADFFREHNPFIRHIVRRTREYLEQTVDPATKEPYLKPVRVRLFGEAADEAVPLPPQLQDAYDAAESFCDIVGTRPGPNSGFLRTILLRRVGSTIHAGQQTARKMLGEEREDGEDDDEAEEPAPRGGSSSLYPLTPGERDELKRFLALLDTATEDPKAAIVEQLLQRGTGGGVGWLDDGCIVFSQYYDSVWWLAEYLGGRLPGETIGIYAGAARSGVFRAGEFVRLPRDEIKRMVRHDELRLVLGTGAASEGLNLQRLGTLINLDLPWNPTRLEQRKGRIQRIGQVRDEVRVYNMRYRGSVEDRVHELLSSRQESIYGLFGQLPDTLEDVWTQVALKNIEKAREIIDAVPELHPFAIRYDRVEPVDWETCGRVLDAEAQTEVLMRGW